MSISSSVEIQKRLADLLQKRKEHEAERDDLLQQTRICESKIAETKLEYARTYNALLSPILTLPVEVTVSIFKQLYGRDERDEISVSHVCSRWRTISLDCPALWSRFLYRMSEESLQAGMMELDRLAVYLRRSRNHLLDLRFAVPMWLNNMTPTVIALLEKVKEHTSRWRYFSLELFRVPSRDSWVHEKVLDQVSPLIPISCRSIQLFEVILPSLSHSAGVSPRAKWIPSPKSSELNWSALSFGRMDVRSFSRCLPPFCITSFQLESKRQHSINLSHFMDFLCSTNYSLVNLSVGPNCLLHTEYRIERTIARELKCFHCEDQILGSQIWSIIYAPRLETLILGDVTFNNIDTLSDRFPTPSFPSLRSLGLFNCSFFSHPAMEELTEATKSASHVYISPGVNGNASEMIFAYTPRSSALILWHNLETLTCSSSMPLEMSHHGYQDVWNFIDRRSQLISSFRLRMSKEDAKRWESDHRPSWDSLQASGCLEKLPSSGEGDNDVVFDVLNDMYWPIPPPQMFW